MPIVVCDNCHTKNRVPGFRVAARTTCGRCGVFLPEPKWLTVARDVRLLLRTHSIFLAGAAVVIAGYFFLPMFQQPRQTAVESGWAPAPNIQQQSLPPPQVPKAAPLPPIEMPKIAQIRPVLTCVPVSVRSGSKKLYSRAPARAPLNISTPAGDNFLIKLVRTGTHIVVLSGYIAGGDTRTFKVPLGTYQIYYAQGQVWCGFKEAFGRRNTHLYQLSGDFVFASSAVSSNETRYEGHEIELVPQLRGNLDSHEVSDADFSALTPAGPSVPDALEGH